MKTIAAFAVAGLAAAASAQSVNLSWSFLDDQLNPITQATVGQQGFALLTADFSAMTGLFAAAGANRQGFQAAFIGGNLSSTGLGYVVDPGTSQVEAFDAFSFLGAGASGTATGGQPGANGTTGWFVAAANVLRFNGNTNPAASDVILVSVTFNAAGTATISAADFGLEFGLFRITRTTPLTLDLNDGTAFNETNLTVSQTAGSIEVVPTPAVAALAGFGGVVAARRRR